MHIDLSIAAERIAMLYQLLDQAQVVEPKEDARPALQVKTGDITFQDVSFTYPGAKKPVLRDVSLRFEGGKLTALVGSSGGGKTTILGLLQGSFRPVGDHRDRRRFDPGCFAEFAAQKRFVSRSRSVPLRRDHRRQHRRIRRGDRPRTYVEAAKRATADGFIQQTKNGYKTQLRELSTNLSGGQSSASPSRARLLQECADRPARRTHLGLDTETEQQIVSPSARWPKDERPS